MWISLWTLLVFLITTAQANGQESISSLRSTVESSNLEVVTLQGIVHLTREHQQQLGGRCGGVAFVLSDDTGSIEVAIRRANRLIEALREGDHVQVTAQIEVFRNRDNVPLRICVEATEIQHLAP